MNIFGIQELKRDRSKGDCRPITETTGDKTRQRNTFVYFIRREYYVNKLFTETLHSQKHMSVCQLQLEYLHCSTELTTWFLVK